MRFWAKKERRQDDRARHQVRAVVSGPRIRFSSTTIDISPSGVLLAAEPHATLAENSLIDLSLSLPKSKRMVRFSSRLVRTTTVEGQYAWALSFEGISLEARSALDRLLERRPLPRTSSDTRFLEVRDELGVDAAEIPSPLPEER